MRLALTPLEPRDALSAAYDPAPAAWRPDAVVIPAAVQVGRPGDSPTLIPVRAVTPGADLSAALIAAASLPLGVQARIRDAGGSVGVFAGVPITATPDYRGLAGFPAGDGRTFDGVAAATPSPGALGLVPPASTVSAAEPVRTTLHEIGHLCELLLATAAQVRDWGARVWPAARSLIVTPYPDAALRSPEECFAEACAGRWSGDAVPAPAADFLAGLGL